MLGEGDTSSFKQIKVKETMRQPRREDRQVLGGTGGLLDVRGGDGSFCRQLRFDC